MRSGGGNCSRISACSSVGQVLEDRHRVVGVDVAHALGDGLRRQFVEDLPAHRVVDLGERGVIEVDAEQLDQARAALGFERFQDGAEIGFVQAADQAAQRFDVGGRDGTGDLAHEGDADRTVLGAQRRRADGHVGHAGLGVDCESAPLVRRGSGKGQMISA